jgi:hypothetical protein
MSEVQGSSGAASLPVSSNSSNEDDRNNNRVDVLGEGAKGNSRQLTEGLSTEQRLLNLATPIDQHKSRGINLTTISRSSPQSLVERPTMVQILRITRIRLQKSAAMSRMMQQMHYFAKIFLPEQRNRLRMS